MLAVYDCGVSPAGWEFLSFLVSAEQARRQVRSEERLTIHVIKPEGAGRRSGLPRLSDVAFWRYYDDVMCPLAHMLPKLASISARDAPMPAPRELVFPWGYDRTHRTSHFGRQLLIQAFQAGCFPLEAAAPRDPDLVTITPGGNPGPWLDAAKWLSESYRVVFVGEDVAGFESREVHSAAEVARIYTSARLNLGSDVACAWMAAAMPAVPFILYQPEDLPVGYEVGRGGFRIVHEAPTAARVKADLADRAAKAPLVFLEKDHPTAPIWVSNMESACARDLPWFVQPVQGGKPVLDCRPAVICAGGSSLADNWQQVRRRSQRGQAIFACNGAGSALIQRGIVPTFVCALDANPEMGPMFFQRTHPDTTYLIASSCAPELFDWLLDRGCKVVVWHPAMGNTGAEDEILMRHSRRTMQWPVAVGGSVTIGDRAFILAYMAGHRELHFYGMDGCYRSGKHHAYDHPHMGLDRYQRVGFPGGTQEYDCAPWMVRQADDFRDTYRGLREQGCSFHPHGEGLIPDMCRYLNRNLEKQAA